MAQLAYNNLLHQQSINIRRPWALKITKFCSEVIMTKTLNPGGLDCLFLVSLLFQQGLFSMWPLFVYSWGVLCSIIDWTCIIVNHVCIFFWNMILIINHHFKVLCAIPICSIIMYKAILYTTLVTVFSMYSMCIILLINFV